ncbi:DUF4198 domain-containing protein [Altererythrobacter arenosus]|uniref:DUF4198 domain-containing protein n=1 Tax=Altererythrobacter arenosus TaxID=3032592 RepID=A0ABY8FTD6_9SPHN|nr:DUF4198 domain-containing protein [Altererythrobacter sp. CAU 1644]WFL78279.1 DUF4198 domain-containing protein [Altererythrobacter sp. CAU 1644]
MTAQLHHLGKPSMRFTQSILGILLATGLLGATSSSAHDGWLELSNAEPKSDDAVEVTLQIGHGSERRTVDLTPLPIWVRRAVVVAPSPSSGASKTHEIEADKGFDLALNESGTHVMALTTFAFTNEMSPKAFNEYLRQQGLAASIEDRETRGLLDEVGREIYHRTAKLILAGDSAGESDIATTPLGLNLEIVPQCIPMAGGCERLLPVQLLFNGRPLDGARVILNDLASNDWPTAASKTDSHGIAHLELPHEGNWMISTIWSWPIKNDERGDYETIFSSLVLSKRNSMGSDLAKTPSEESSSEQTH